MVNNDVQKILSRHEKLETEKANYISLWQEIGDFCYPQGSNMQRYYEKGQKRRRMIYDSTAETALDIAAAGIIGLIANPTTKYISFKAPKSLEDNNDVKTHAQEARDYVLNVFSDPRTGFYSSLVHCVKQWLAFGTTPFMIDADEDIVAKFRSDTPRGLNFTEDFQGNVNERFLEREMSITALQDKVNSEDWEVPEKVLKKPSDDKVKVLRYVYKNPDYDPTLMGRRGAMWLSCYYLVEEKAKIKEDFFYTQPIAVGRYEKLDMEKWGDSPTRMVLADVKMLNLAERFMTVYMEKELNPTLFVSSEAKFGKLDLSGGAVNVGRGNPNDTIRELRSTGRAMEVAQWMEQKRETIRKALFNDLFQMIDATGIQNVNNGVAYLFNQERLRVLAPKVMRFQSEIIGVAAERVYDIAVRQGRLKVPQALQNAELTVQYSSPATQAQRGEEANAIMQYLADLNQIIASVGQVDPEKAGKIIARIDSDFVAKELADIRGVSTRVLRDTEDVKQEEAKQQQAQAMQQLAILQQAAETGKTIKEVNAPQ